MDKIDVLISAFHNKRNSHPQLTKFWIKYLNIKKIKLLELERCANHALENMNDVGDISLENVLTIYLLNDII